MFRKGKTSGDVAEQVRVARAASYQVRFAVGDEQLSGPGAQNHGQRPRRYVGGGALRGSCSTGGDLTAVGGQLPRGMPLNFREKTLGLLQVGGSSGIGVARHTRGVAEGRYQRGWGRTKHKQIWGAA